MPLGVLEGRQRLTRPVPLAATLDFLAASLARWDRHRAGTCRRGPEGAINHQAMLTREMSHRVKNSLASVGGDDPSHR